MAVDFGAALATTVQEARQQRGLTVAALGDAAGVSRAMVSKIERGETQPTAALLAKLSGALGLTLSELVGRAEKDTARLRRRADQPTWSDPDTDYVRRAVSPSASTAVELVDVDLPSGAEIAYPAEAYSFIDQQVWVLEGHLQFHEGTQVWELDAGDCLQLGEPADCVFRNPTSSPSRYLVVVNKSAGPRRGR